MPVDDPTDVATLRSGFVESAKRHGRRPALVVGGTARSYEEVDHQARIWAHAMAGEIGGRAQRVGVFAHGSAVGYVGAMAALFSGAAYVPLSPGFPIQRTRSMIRRADLDALIVDAEAAGQLDNVLSPELRPPLVILPEQSAWDVKGAEAVLGKAELEHVQPLDALPGVSEGDVAYLLFTSGSTGEPKGVPVTHRNVRHFVEYNVERYGIGPEDRFSQTFSRTFDLSIFDMFAAWERGACVHAMRPIDLLAPARFVREHDITVWFSVPSVAALMRMKGTLQPGCLAPLRWSLFCGEPLPRATAQAWHAAAPNSIVENLYGPTELTISCTVHRWDPERSASMCTNGQVPIGRPYPGLHALVVDDELRPVAEGEAGELCVAGPQTVPGYWRDAEQTRLRFVELERESGVVDRYYRTGDQVRWLPEGAFAFLGRVDDQIKVRGHRVELAEVEAALRNDPAVVEAAALGWPVVDGSAQGVAAFVAGTSVEPDRLRAAALEALPRYMAPNEIRVLAELPHNANGKIDRKALRERLEREGS